MSEVQFAFRIRQHLNRGLQELRPDISDRLAASRERALAAQRQVQHQSVLAGAGSFFQNTFESARVKQALASFAVVICVVCSTLWLADHRVAELGAIDSALLADDLPIGAFTDKGFHVWLSDAASD